LKRYKICRFMVLEEGAKQNWAEARKYLNMVRSSCSKYEEARILAARVREKLEGSNAQVGRTG